MNVLFLAPEAFGYEKSIEKSLSTKVDEVFFFNERPFNSSLGKILVRLNWKLLTSWWTNRYYQGVFNSIKGKRIDFVLILVPESVPVWFIKRLKEINPKIEITVYMWDSVNNKNHIFNILSHCDRVYSFDHVDCVEYAEFIFLPLFFSEEYFPLKIEDKDQEIYDMCFIGTVHSNRSQILSKLISNSNGKNFIYWYCPSRLLFVIKKIFTNEFDEIRYKDVNFCPLPRDKVIDVIRKSKVVLDVPHPEQTGLTMRTLEVIASGKKLATTNLFITDYDFYKQNRIFLIKEDFVVPRSFLDTSQTVNFSSLKKNYGINSWVSKILNLEDG
ncbi:hypothetical protein [Vibrio owensii]|uniref:hypothetical protein n=1 Tax=Vibrio owensii TaxID=696485 RepID=UPI0005ED5E00|nr:hypothetical protein [Vibrio owensii]